MKPTIRLEKSGQRNLYKIAGEWTADYAGLCLAAVSSITLLPNTTAGITCGGVERIDITGAWILNRRIEELKLTRCSLELEHFEPEHKSFLNQVGALQQRQPKTPPNEESKHFLDWVQSCRQHLYATLAFLGWCWVLILQAFRHPTSFRFRAFIKQCEMAAVRAAPIVGVISFLIAIVLAYQGSGQLKRFGAEIFSVNLVTISVLREMGSLLTAIMVAGRSGSAFAAEIGAMKLNEEVDALSTIGLQPMEILVLPRIIALTLMMPLLTFLADISGLLGCGLLTVLTTKTSWLLFTSRLLDAISMTDFWIGIGKAPVFGFAIAVVGCYHGMLVTTSAESVGRETTNAVVNSIFLVMIIDALFSIIFTNLGL